MTVPKFSDVYRDLWNQFHEIRDIASTLDAYYMIDALEAQHKLTAEEVRDLRGAAFCAVRTVTRDDQLTASNFLLNAVLPHSLDSSPQDSDGRYHRHQIRELLRDWLDDFEEPDRSTLRQAILAHVNVALQSPEPDSACWTAGVLGYRTAKTTAALWRLVDTRNDESGDTALSVLSSFGMDPPEFDRILEATLPRLPLRCNVHLIGALRRLSSPACLELVRMHYLRPDNEDFWPIYAPIILRILSAVADIHHEDIHLQEAIWRTILDLRRVDPKTVDANLCLGSDFAPRCNSSRVLPDLINELISDKSEGGSSEIRRIQLLQRLQDFVQPQQLEGWSTQITSLADEIIRQDFYCDSGTEGPFKSVSGRLKELARNCLFYLGDRAILEAPNLAVSILSETSPYLRSTLLESFACFKIEPAPDFAIQWVRERIDVGRGQHDSELFCRSAATRLLRSSATREAFDSLLAFGITIDGAALRSSVDAVIDVGLYLARTGDSSIERDLLETLRRGSARNSRIAAAETVREMAANGLLSQVFRLDFSSTLKDADRDDYERSRIVEILRFLPEQALSDGIEHQLAIWAEGKNDLGRRSLQVLARHGRLLNHPALLTRRLGLLQSTDRWELDEKSKEADSDGFTLGLLYASQPEVFEDVVADFIKSKDWIYASELIHFMDQLLASQIPKQTVNRSKFVDSLVERIKRWQNRAFADMDLFELLGRWDSTALAIEPWEKLWHDWLPDARVAIADALGRAEFSNSHSRTRALDQLVGLTRDGIYAVRRSAYRSICHVSLDTLKALCNTSVFQTSEDGLQPALAVRKRGAEAAAWLPGETFGPIYSAYSRDPEIAVRDTIERIRIERRARLAGEHCLRNVLSISDDSTEKLPTVWRFGAALIQTGDDACIKTIRERCAATWLPPNFRYWLERMAEGMIEQWRKTTQKWPEPWLSWTGSVEEGLGEIIGSDSLSLSVRYCVWKQPDSTPNKLIQWGGAAWPTENALSQFLRPHYHTLIFSSGKRGTIATVSNSNQLVLFSGNGPFPL